MAGMHAREDGSFGRSAGTQTLKGAALLLVAVVIGVVLLHTAPKAATTVSTGGSTPLGHTPTTKAPKKGHTTPTTAAPAATTTTLPPAHPANQVSVVVANGAGVAGLAGKIRGQLNLAGYNTAKPAVNAPANVATSSVYYVAGYQPDALAVAAALSLAPASVQPMPSPPPLPAADVTGAQVLVIAGADIGAATTTTGTTEAPPGNTIAPSPTEASGGQATTTVHQTAAPTTAAPTTVAHTPTTTRTATTVHTPTTR